MDPWLETSLWHYVCRPLTPECQRIPKDSGFKLQHVFQHMVKTRPGDKDGRRRVLGGGEGV